MTLKTFIDSDLFLSAAQTRKFPGIVVVGLSDVKLGDDGALSRDPAVLHFVSLTTAHGVARATREYMVEDSKAMSPERFIRDYGEVISVVLADLTRNYPEVSREGFILCLTPVGSDRVFSLSDYPEFQVGGKFEDAFIGEPDSSYAKALEESRKFDQASFYSGHKGGDSRSRTAGFGPSRC